MIQLIQNQLVGCNLTVEECYRKMLVFYGETDLLNILDKAGQQEGSAVEDKYIRARGFFCVFAIKILNHLKIFTIMENKLKSERP